MIISRAPKSFRWFYGVSLACGAMCLILAIGGRTIADGAILLAGWRLSDAVGFVPPSGRLR